MNKQYIGLTAFGNVGESVRIPEWNLDATYEEQLAKAVQSVFKADTIMLSRFRADFAEVNSLNGPYNAPAFWGPNFSKIEEGTRKACQANGLDAVVVVARWKTRDLLGGTNQPVEGVGIYSRRSESVVHALSKIGYMDCKSGKALAIASLFKESSSGANSFGARVPTAPIPAELATKAYSNWTPEEKERVRNALSALPTSAWTPTLQGMLATR